MLKEEFWAKLDLTWNFGKFGFIKNQIVVNIKVNLSSSSKWYFAIVLDRRPKGERVKACPQFFFLFLLRLDTRVPDGNTIDTSKPVGKGLENGLRLDECSLHHWGDEVVSGNWDTSAGGRIGEASPRSEKGRVYRSHSACILKLDWIKIIGFKGNFTLAICWFLIKTEELEKIFVKVWWNPS